MPDKDGKKNCKHEWVIKPYAYNFLVCDKCGGWTQDKIHILYPKEDGND